MAATTPRLGIDHLTVIPADPDDGGAGTDPDRNDGTDRADGADPSDAS